MKDLTTDQKNRYTELDGVIKRGLKTYYEVAAAAHEMRTSKVYRHKYDTFEQYCKAELGLTPQHVGRMIKSAKVIENLEPNGSILKTEGQARALSKAPPEKQQEILDETRARTGSDQPTAHEITETIDRAKIEKEASEAPRTVFPDDYSPQENQVKELRAIIEDQQDRINQLETEGLIENSNLSEEGKLDIHQEMARLRQDNERLEIELRAVKLKRDELMRVNAEQQQRINWLTRELKASKKVKD